MVSLFDKRRELETQRRQTAEKPPSPPAALLVETPATGVERPTNTGGAIRLVPPPTSTAKVETSVPAPALDSSYMENLREKSEFEREKPAILKDTTPSIDFGTILTSESPSSGAVGTAESDSCTENGHMPGYIWGLGMRPANVHGTLSLVSDSPKNDAPDEDDFSEGDGVYHQLVDGIAEDETPRLGVLSLLNKHSLALQDGPYADKDGIVAAFADILFKGAKRDKLNELIERIIDIRPFTVPEFEVGQFQRKFPLQLGFISRRDFTPPDELPNAGNILRQERLMQLKSGKKFQLTHPMEQYILAVAALRTRGFNAYPAIATLTDSDGQPASSRPLIAVIDMKNQNPLTTFDFNRRHPEMDTMTVLSDVAVMGVLHSMRAETRCKHLAAEMVEMSKHGTLLQIDDAEVQLERISRSLCESTKRWDEGNPFIANTMMFLASITRDAVIETALNLQKNASGEAAAGAVREYISRMLDAGVDPNSLLKDEDPAIREAANALSAAMASKENFTRIVQTHLGAYLTNAKKQEAK